MPKDRLLRLALCVLCVLCAAAPCAAQTPATVTVVNKKTGAPVTGLPREAFTLSDGKTPQEITSFVGADEPASVAILLDLSGSVRAGAGLRKLRDAVEALTRLVRAGNPSNVYSVVTFADEVVTVLEASRSPEEAAEALRALPGAKPGTQSSLFDACWFAGRRLAADAHAKRVMILVTDGVDTYSRARDDDMTRLLKETNVVVYSVNIGEEGPAIPGVRVRGEGQKVLEGMSKVSGGLALGPDDAKDVGARVERVAAELRGQYVVGFRPEMPPPPGRCLKLKTEVKPPTDFAPEAKALAVRAREEFCTPPPPVNQK